MTLEKIEAYVHAHELGNEIWDCVNKWDKFARWSIGIQISKSADSMSANIAEGFGRYYKKEKIRFYRYSSGSAWETREWLIKAKNRKLIPDEQVDVLISGVEELPKMINRLILYTNQKLKY
ncbi:four helix bundle protein [Flavilitoribacter nigricans]|nr:four helix bundle protein [Flavilitoribacter nigricans]